MRRESSPPRSSLAAAVRIAARQIIWTGIGIVGDSISDDMPVLAIPDRASALNLAEILAATRGLLFCARRWFLAT